MSDPRRKPYWERANVHVIRGSVGGISTCPRCGMDAAVMKRGKISSTRCFRCSLMPTHISVWDEESRVQVYVMPLTSTRVEEVLTWTKTTRRACQIWEGDVLVAHWAPETKYVTYFNGRCGE